MKLKLHQDFPDLIFGLSMRRDGPMNLKPQAGENDAAYAANRQKFFSKIGLAQADAVFAVSRHEANVVKVGADNRGRKLPGVDGLVSNEPGTFLALTVADCVPIYLFDPVRSAWGLVHAGWRGIAAGIITAGIRSMQENFQSRLEDMRLAAGPAIQKCHFEVKADVLEKFRDYPDQVVNQDGKTMLNLPGIIRSQAQKSGLFTEHIETSEECTFCLTKRYFSYRREHNQPLETMLAYVGWRQGF